MSEGLTDKVKAQIDEILAEKFPEQKGLNLTKLREKVLTRLRERLPYALIPLAIELIFAQGEDVVERLRERLPYVLTALTISTILSTVHEELDKLGRSKPCKSVLPESDFCEKGKRWGSACLDCEDYEPMEEE